MTAHGHARLTGLSQVVLTAEKVQFIQCLHLVYDPYHNLRRAGGIEVQGTKVNRMQRRRVANIPIIEEHRFVTRRLQKFSVEETSHFEATLNSSVEVTEELLTHSVENIEPNQSLLQFLIAMQKESFDSATLASTLQSALLSRANFREEDILSTALLEEDPLRDVIDVVVENTRSIKLSVLEIAKDKSVAAMGPRVSALLSKYIVCFNTEYAV
ncbi:hypothetical protein HPB51_028822 [Rhipicephalus microplus]|uniref:Uncharacterized protein n=1 Tax=Rhipicephalus microplus TaxID=6941 RepID=A0A9J6CWS6_RHIMP|nr:hypothetical protein HPB51_028822 [Rhipicephalus microplus]